MRFLHSGVDVYDVWVLGMNVGDTIPTWRGGWLIPTNNSVRAMASIMSVLYTTMTFEVKST